MSITFKIPFMDVCYKTIEDEQGDKPALIAAKSYLGLDDSDITEVDIGDFGELILTIIIGDEDRAMMFKMQHGDLLI